MARIMTDIPAEYQLNNSNMYMPPSRHMDKPQMNNTKHIIPTTRGFLDLSD